MNLFSKNQPVNIQRDCYAIAMKNGSHADITMYGYVVRKHPVDYRTGERIKGDFIAQDTFMEDLEEIKDAKTITIRMNSVGGDVYAALPIHNRLRELKAEVTVIVDGVAMSAASFIMCAADKVKVNEASLVMIHKASLFLFFEVFNADQMRELAGFLDKVDETIVTAYVRKTGMDKDELLTMMGNETFMTGKEAVDKGFADEILEDGKALNIAASADKRTLFVGNHAINIPDYFQNFMENIPTVEPEAEPSATEEINQNQSAQSDERKVGTTMNLEELKNKHPDTYAKLQAEAHAAASAELSNDASKDTAVADERKRLQEIDEIADLFDDELVLEAKYGDKSCTAEELTLRAAKKAKAEGKSFMKNLQADADASGADDVPATDGGNAPEAAQKTEEQLYAEAKEQAQTLLGKKEG